MSGGRSGLFKKLRKKAERINAKKRADREAAKRDLAAPSKLHSTAMQAAIQTKKKRKAKQSESSSSSSSSAARVKRQRRPVQRRPVQKRTVKKEEDNPVAVVRAKMLANFSGRANLNEPVMSAMHIVDPHREAGPEFHLHGIADLEELFAIADMAPADAARMVAAKEDAKKDPWINAAFYQLFQKMTAGKLVSALSGSVRSQEQLAELLRQRLCVLPEFTVEHENNLLRQSGSFTTRDGRSITFPVCIHGDKCAAMIHEIPNHQRVTTKRPLTAIMSEKEFSHLMRTNQGPVNRAPCVLCHRAQVQDFMVTVLPNLHKVSVSDDTIVQLYMNRVGCEGGYVKQFCWLPVVNETVGLVGPVAMYNVNSLCWAQDPDISLDQDRWIVKQQDNVYKSLALRPPRVGETVQHFRKRSAALSVRLSEALTSHYRLFCGHDFRHALLQYFQDNNLSQTEPEHPNKIQALYVATVARFNAATQIEDPTPAQIEDAYDAALSLDTLRYAPERIWLPHNMILCEETVSPSIRFVLHTCIWMQRSQHSDPIVHILSKALPQKCRTRRWWEVVRDRLLQQKGNFENRHVVMQWFVCSLLGNYHHVSPESYAPVKNRKSLYSILDAPAESVMKMLETLQAPLQFVLREQLVIAMRSDPVFCKHVGRLMDWKAYESSVIQTMNKLRVVAQTHDLASAFYKTGGSFEGWEGLEKMAEMTKDGHKSVLRLFYRRQKQSLSRIYYLFHPRTAIRRIGTAKRSARKLTAEEQAMQAIERSVLSTVGWLGEREIALIDEERKEQTDTESHEATSSSASSSSGPRTVEVTQDHSDILWAFVCRIPVHTPDAIVPLMQALPAFGVPSVALNDAMELFMAYDYDALGKKRFRALVDVFAEKWPYTHALLALGSLFWKERSGFSIYQLSAHTLELQKQAVRENFGVPVDSPKLPAMPGYLYICPACTQIRSTFRDPKRTSGVPYTHGFIKTASNFLTGEVYCRTTDRVNTITGKRCGDEPLVRIPLYGRAVVVNDRVVIICAQKGCGVAMIVDPTNCVYNERGYACSACTMRIFAERRKELFDHALAPWQYDKCDFCTRKMHEKDACVFPHGIALCCKCSGSTLAVSNVPRFIRERFAAGDTVINKDDVVAYLWSLRDQVRRDFSDRMKSSRNKRVSASRRATRSRR